MTFEIRWTETSFRKIQKLEPHIQERIIARLDEAAAADDLFAIAKRLTGVNLYSIRVGDYRVIVSIEKNKMIILVVDLGH
ncbi:MAG: cytotoxic translational repressor of toxin-antitoxin stability system [Nitrososphaera sp.]|nr:cytotoxic translational repressor of toxin-antitoxin stability system [Nitrososphaera sp.]